jgi:hypothetical protein
MAYENEPVDNHSRSENDLEPQTEDYSNFQQKDDNTLSVNRVMLIGSDTIWSI